MPFINIPSYGSASWKDPVADPASLPASGNELGDARVTESTSEIYVWDGSAWQNVGGSASAITALTNDVTATGPGSVAATVAFVGGETAADVATSVQDTQAATDLSTVSTIVKRDGSGETSLDGLNLDGSVSGAINIKAADTTTGYTVKMPSAQGGAGTFLENDGSGNLSWGSVGALPAYDDDKVLYSTSTAAEWRTVGTGSTTAAYPANTVIVGRAKPTGLTGTGNIIVGSGAGTNQTSGTNNVIIGLNAANNSNGSNQVAIGSSAVVGASGYIAIGASANANAVFGIAIGNSSSVTATGGIAIGGSSAAGLDAAALGLFASSNTDCVAVGHSAASASNGAISIGRTAKASGINTIAIGKSAGRAAATGANNIIMGNAAGDALTTGNNNVFIGQNSGGATNTGVDNTCVGHSTATSATSGSANVVLGSSAASTLTTGTSNVLIGSGANTAANNTTSAISLGRESVAASNEMAAGSASYQINTVLLGRGGASQAAANAVKIQTMRASGTDTDMSVGTLTIAGAQGTGTGPGGDVIIATAAPSLSSGSALNNHVEVMRITDTGLVGIQTSTPNDPLTVQGSINYTNGTSDYKISPAHHDHGTETTNFTINWSTSPVQTVTLNGTTNAVVTLQNAVQGGAYVLRVIQGATPGTIDFTAGDFANAVWPGGTAPTLSGSTGDVDIINLLYIDDGGGTVTYYGTFAADFS